MLRILSSAIAVVSGAFALDQGFKTSVDVSVIDSAKDAYWQTVIDAINKIELPDVKDEDGNYMEQNSFEIQEGMNSVEFRTDQSKHAMVFANKKVSGKFKSKKFRYKVGPGLVSKGHVEVDLKQIDIEIGMAFSLRTLPDGH